MKQKKIVSKIGKKLPITKHYLRYRDLTRHAQMQADEITGLHEAVERLEARNELWAEEVRTMRGDNQLLTIVWPVKPEDIVQANFEVSQPQKNESFKKGKAPFAITWVVPPMGQGSGGHADIFRTISYLESKGHSCRLYFYDALKQSSLETIRENIKYYSPVKAEIFYNEDNIKECDAIFATNWYTAYPVYNFKGSAKKYYYVQDFEPYFDAVGSYSILAENTYKLGLRGITLGSWLAEKLTNEYGMVCDYFELGVDPKEYFITNKNIRKKVLFYARPVTPRRGFELGILSLELFHKEHPEYEIHFLGWDTSRYEISFPYVNHGIMSVEELNKLYNECAAGLVLSFTNMSLLPLEMLASGCIPVMNEAYHTRHVSYTEHLKYSEPNPRALAKALYEAVSSKEQLKNAEDAAESAKKLQWENSNMIINNILTNELSGR